MSDPLASLRIQADRTLKTFTDIDRATPRASMWTVREGGRKVGQAARRRAPVLRGRGGVSRKQAAAGGLAVNPNAPVRGLLKSSIRSAKRLERTGEGEFAVRVAPRGPRAHLYSRKAEAQTRYMAGAYDEVAPQMHAIAERAWARATKKG